MREGKPVHYAQIAWVRRARGGLESAAGVTASAQIHRGLLNRGGLEDLANNCSAAWYRRQLDSLLQTGGVFCWSRSALGCRTRGAIWTSSLAQKRPLDADSDDDFRDFDKEQARKGRKLSAGRPVLRLFFERLWEYEANEPLSGMLLIGPLRHLGPWRSGVIDALRYPAANGE